MPNCLFTSQSNQVTATRNSSTKLCRRMPSLFREFLQFCWLLWLANEATGGGMNGLCCCVLPQCKLNLKIFQDLKCQIVDDLLEGAIYRKHASFSHSNASSLRNTLNFCGESTLKDKFPETRTGVIKLICNISKNWLRVWCKKYYNTTIYYNTTLYTILLYAKYT